MLEKVDRLADKDLDRYEKVVITTKDGEVCVINRGSIIFPWSSTEAVVDVQIVACREGRKLSLRLLSEEQPLVFIISGKSVTLIEGKEK